MNQQSLTFIDAILCNDEVSTDEELIQHFVTHLTISVEEATAVVAKRDEKFNEFFNADHECFKREFNDPLKK
jgi:hypothetical protein